MISMWTTNISASLGQIDWPGIHERFGKRSYTSRLLTDGERYKIRLGGNLTGNDIREHEHIQLPILKSVNISIDCFLYATFNPSYLVYCSFIS